MCKENISEKKKFTMPHIFIILYAIILLVGLLSYVLPAGVYDRVADATTGRMIINPASYHVV